MRSLGPYEGSLRAILHALKYDGHQTLARRLGAAAHPVLDDVPDWPGTLLVPVPLHRSKGLARGFNQAELLARGLHVQWPVRQALRRLHPTDSQTRFDRSHRHENVARAFAATAVGFWARRGAALAGAHVVLVDDVITTGATASACADALRRAGAVKVALVAFARTRRPAAWRGDGPRRRW